MPTLVELYRADLADVTNTHVKRAVRLYWFRAAVEQLHERSITAIKIPRRRTIADYVDPHLPFWRSRSDEEIDDLIRLLAPYFRRKDNMNLSLQ